MDSIKNSPPFEICGDGPWREIAAPAQSLALPHPNDAAKVTPWEVDFRQLGPGRLDTALTVRASAHLSILNLSLTERVHQRGVAPAGQITFAFVASHLLRNWHGKSVVADTLLCFGTGEAFDSISEAGFRAIVVSVDSGRLLSVAEACGIDLPDTLEKPAQYRASEDALALRRAAGRARGMLDQTANGWTMDAEDALTMDLLAPLTDPRQCVDKSASNLRQRALTRALDVMEACTDEPLAISEICRESGVSWRTLDRAFRERFGIGPKAYLMRLRLNRVRRDLLAGETAGRIADTANLHGFWHLGQFARDYRKLFGELPSETFAS